MNKSDNNINNKIEEEINSFKKDTIDIIAMVIIFILLNLFIRMMGWV